MSMVKEACALNQCSERGSATSQLIYFELTSLTYLTRLLVSDTSTALTNIKTVKLE